MHTDCGPNRLRRDEQCVQYFIASKHKFYSLLLNRTLPTVSTLPTVCTLPTVHTLQSAILASNQLHANNNWQASLKNNFTVRLLYFMFISSVLMTLMTQLTSLEMRIRPLSTVRVGLISPIKIQ